MGIQALEAPPLAVRILFLLWRNWSSPSVDPRPEPKMEYVFSTENRHYGKTKMNERSSRSHAIFRMVSSLHTRTGFGQHIHTRSYLTATVAHRWVKGFVLPDPWKSRVERSNLRRDLRRCHHRVPLGESVTQLTRSHWPLWSCFIVFFQNQNQNQVLLAK